VTILSRRMSWDELFDEIDEEEPAPTGIDWAAVIREHREERDRELGGEMAPDDPDR
jgi:hypothetical protein